jgi:hypothetical protein
MCLNETGAVSAVSTQASGLNLHMGSLESIMPWDHASSGTPLPEHLPQIVYEDFRLFIGSKMPARIMIRFEHDV